MFLRRRSQLGKDRWRPAKQPAAAGNTSVDEPVPGQVKGRLWPRFREICRRKGAQRVGRNLHRRLSRTRAPPSPAAASRSLRISCGGGQGNRHQQSGNGASSHTSSKGRLPTVAAKQRRWVILVPVSSICSVAFLVGSW